MDRIEEKPKFAFLGNSHMAFWALDIYFPQWECLNYGAPGEGLAYVESFAVDTSDCQVVVQFGTNDIYQLNDENIDEYVERYVKAVLAVPSLKTYLFCIFPRNDYDDYSTAVNKFIQILNRKIHEKLQGTDIVYPYIRQNAECECRILLYGRIQSFIAGWQAESGVDSRRFTFEW